MPELSDDMYCSQQIIVPPMFPYLLRQYAKAAIRSQPSDLLRWSTAYFRCLSLNLPPPIKPRLEYPIPKDYDGITPGWLRALLYQFQNSSTVNFKLLWDRWIGACLNHQTLIKILCLGGFQDPMAIQFLRFLGLCCAFVSENLTQTMILVCEVLTEEPEGGSTMITVETFLDIYTFLANIDASKDQILLNSIFTDSLLDLLEKQEKKKVEEKTSSTVTEEKEPTVESETVEEEEKVDEDKKETISCPDLNEVVQAASSEDVSPGEGSVEAHLSKSDAQEGETEAKEEKSATEVGFDILSLGLPDGESVEEEEVKNEEERGEEEEEVAGEEEQEKELVPPPNVEEETKVGEEVEEEEEDGCKSVVKRDFCADLEEAGEGVVQGGVAKGGLLPEDDHASYAGFTMATGSVTEPSEVAFDVEEIEVEAIPGIGGIVPQELIEAVSEYMKLCASRQHGMVMPRNIRHYSCPPLEVFD